MNVNIIYFALLSGIAALVFALIRNGWVNSRDAGNERVQEIMAAIREGAMAFITKEYKVLSVFVIAVAGYC